MRTAGVALAVILAVPAAALDVAQSSAPPGAEGALIAAGMRRLAGTGAVGEHLVRIGLEPAHRVRVTSNRPFRIVDPRDERAAWLESYSGEVWVLAEGGPEGEIARVYRVQAGAFQDQDAAELELARLESLSGASGIVRRDPDRGVWRVRLGRETDRLALGPLVARLRAAGVEGGWISEEPATTAEGVRLRLVDPRWESALVDGVRLAVVPALGARIQIDGKAYRGVIELRIDAAGRVRPINWIEIEEYLRGVVPSELGPAAWPQLQALKAQAVAARTYTWRKLGQFEDEGFDLCSTPRCQVYDGADVEHPLSDRALTSTRGEILTWQRRPIEALYTSTCGGHTEDARSVFPEHDEPYLVGVPCRAEASALEARTAVIKGRGLPYLVDETGTAVGRAFGLLAAAGVIDPGADWPGRARAALDARELRSWTAALARIAGRPLPDAPLAEFTTLGAAAQQLLSDLGWDLRSSLLLAEDDLAALLRDAQAEALPTSERRALAYLGAIEALGPGADGSWLASAPPSRLRLLPALARAGESWDAFGLRSATFVALSEGRIALTRNGEPLRLPLAARPILIGRIGGRSLLAPELQLWPGDRVSYRTSDGIIDYIELEAPVKGTADDRISRDFSWELRRTRAELDLALGRRLSVGGLRDLRVLRRGVSGRIVELEVVGSAGSQTLHGFNIRKSLELGKTSDLRETPSTIELQRGADGEIRAAVFAGKGWGHGVGMCQVGAYGMAVRGRDYREILAHYYRGTAIERLDDPAR